MSLNDWFERIRGRETSKELTVLVEGVKNYLLAHPENNEFFPSVVAAALHTSEVKTLAAFGELDDAHIVKPLWITYCKNDSRPIHEYSNRDDVPVDEPDAPCGPVSLDDESMYVDLAFVVNRDALQSPSTTA